MHIHLFHYTLVTPFVSTGFVTSMKVSTYYCKMWCSKVWKRSDIELVNFLHDGQACDDEVIILVNYNFIYSLLHCKNSRVHSTPKWGVLSTTIVKGVPTKVCETLYITTGKQNTKQENNTGNKIHSNFSCLSFGFRTTCDEAGRILGNNCLTEGDAFSELYFNTRISSIE